MARQNICSFFIKTNVQSPNDSVFIKGEKRDIVSGGVQNLCQKKKEKDYKPSNANPNCPSVVAH